MEVVRASQRGDQLGPLRAALDRVIELAQLVKGFKLEPSETELKGIGRELASSKVRVQSLARPLMRSDNLAVAREVHKMAREADEVTSRVDEEIFFSKGGLRPAGMSGARLERKGRTGP
jgi:hypothetical protein